MLIIANHMHTSGLFLQKLRVLKGIKQETIAKQLGISQPRYCQLEKKERIRADLFTKLVETMGYTSDEVEKMRTLFADS